jgi:hypothetical protein
MIPKALQVCRLYEADKINFNHPIPNKNDPNWIKTTDRKPDGFPAQLVWAKDSNDFIFKAFYITGTMVTNGLWPADTDLDNHELGSINFWMPLPEPAKESK